MLTDKLEFLDDFNPDAIAKKIAFRAKQLRLSMNLTQSTLAQQSGVSLGSLKRFEHTGEISLKNILNLAVVLNATAEFKELFVKLNSFNTIDEVLKAKNNHLKKRARTKHE